TGARYDHRSFFFFASRRRHPRFSRDGSSDVCSSDLPSRAWPGLAGPGRAWPSRAEPGRAGLAPVTPPPPPLPTRPANPHTAAGKIGRASCRERVQITVVALIGKRERTKSETPHTQDT